MAYTPQTTLTPNAGGAYLTVTTGDEEVAGAGGDFFAILNDSGVDRLIEDASVDVTDASAAAATLDVGISADAVTVGDTVLDGVDLNTVAITHKVTGTGNSSPEPTLWPATQYVTGTKKTGAASAENSLVFKFSLKWRNR